MNAQRLGAVGIIIGNNVESDSLYLMGYAPDYTGSVTIPAVFVSGKSYQLMTQILQSYMFGKEQVQATLEDTTEESPVGNPNTPPPLTPNPPMDTGVSPPSSPTGTAGGVIIDDPPTDGDVPDTEVDSGVEVVWYVIGVIIVFKCMIVTIALRRKCKQDRMARRVGSSASASSSSSSSTPLTEGEVSDEGELPVVYATSPPTRGFTVAAPSSSSSSSSSRALTATNLSAYPSIQYAPLMPQATAPSDMYDLEKQPIIIRG
jgi:hypothetical protein